MIKVNVAMNIIRIASAVLFAMISTGTNAGSLTLEERLGRLLYRDVNLSAERNQSCESCHSTKPLTINTREGEIGRAHV